MTCRCTCGGCDCPQIKIHYFPDVGAAAAPAVNWGYGNYVAGAAAGPQIKINCDFANGAAACAFPNIKVYP